MRQGRQGHQVGRTHQGRQADGHRRDRRRQGCHRSGRRQRGLIATELKESTEWQLAQPTSQRPASSATCVAGWSSCCSRWWSTASARTFPCPASTRTSSQQLFKGQQGGILSLFNMFSGGALSRFTVFALGIMPYISASIIMQLMTYVVPTFEQLKKEGEAGRRKITQYTRYGTLGLALFQSLGIAVALEGSAGLVIEPGLRLPHDRGGQPDGRHHVPDVAGRADHRARSGQRHLDPDLRRYRGRPAERDRRLAGAGAHRRHEHPGRDRSSSPWWCW